LQDAAIKISLKSSEKLKFLSFYILWHDKKLLKSLFF
jgi:hypothetical protein